MQRLVEINCAIPVTAGVYLHRGMIHIVEIPQYECLRFYLRICLDF
jgi:hypothetical protein